jgi:hypothetical protein
LGGKEMKKEQSSSLWERLKICWNALTKSNYAFFAVNNDFIEFYNSGKYKTVKRKAISAYSCITYDVSILLDGKPVSLHDFIWKTIEVFSKEAQKGKY